MSIDLREIVIDNSNPIVSYEGQWSVDIDLRESLGNMGTPLFNGQQVTRSNSASLRFPFTGTSVKVYGTANVTLIDGQPNTSWECFVDGKSVGSDAADKGFQNNWILCNESDLNATSHELVLHVTKNPNQFWFDYATYRPPPSETFSNKVVKVFTKNPMFTYDQSWTNVDLETRTTDTANSSVTILFTGKELHWYGPALGGNPRKDASAQYTIDGKTSGTFDLKADKGKIQGDTSSTPSGNSSTPTLSRHNIPYLSLTNLTQGPHNLTVQYAGQKGDVPLLLSHLYIVNGTNPTSGSSSTGRPGGALKIAGIVLGALVLLGGLTAALFALSRYRTKRSNIAYRSLGKTDDFSMADLDHDEENLLARPRPAPQGGAGVPGRGFTRS